MEKATNSLNPNLPKPALASDAADKGKQGHRGQTYCQGDPGCHGYQRVHDSANANYVRHQAAAFTGSPRQPRCNSALLQHISQACAISRVIAL